MASWDEMAAASRTRALLKRLGDAGYPLPDHLSAEDGKDVRLHFADLETDVVVLGRPVGPVEVDYWYLVLTDDATVEYSTEDAVLRALSS